MRTLSFSHKSTKKKDDAETKYFIDSPITKQSPNSTVWERMPVIVWYVIALVITLLICIMNAKWSPNPCHPVHEYPWWNDCDPSWWHEYPYGGKRTDALYHQLKDIVEVLEQHNVPCLLSHGTLLGATRNQETNPCEVHNDVVMLQPCDEWERTMEIIRQDLYDRKLIFFKDVPGARCVKICRRLEEGQSRRFGAVKPYGDGLYPPFTNLGYGIENVDFEKREINQLWVTTPDDNAKTQSQQQHSVSKLNSTKRIHSALPIPRLIWRTSPIATPLYEHVPCEFLADDQFNLISKSNL